MSSVGLARIFGKAETKRVLHAATQLSVLLVEEHATKSDAKSEQLHAKIISLLFPTYRSHSEQLFRLRKGVFTRSPGISLPDLDFFDDVCKHCQATWLALSWKGLQPCYEDCYKALSHVIHHLPKSFYSSAILFQGDDTWCGEMVNLCSKLRDEFNFHSSLILRSFHRWDSTDIPIDQVNGANFDDVYIRIKRNGKKRRKTERNNVYTTIPGRLNTVPTDTERKC